MNEKERLKRCLEDAIQLIIDILPYFAQLSGSKQELLKNLQNELNSKLTIENKNMNTEQYRELKSRVVALGRYL